MGLDLGSMVHTTVTSGTTYLGVDDIKKMFDAMYDHARAQPDVWYVSPLTVKRLRHLQRVDKLYRAHPLPPRKIRKCKLRRVYAARHRGMARIARTEQREAREEAEYMRHLCEDSPQDWETYVSAKGRKQDE